MYQIQDITRFLETLAPLSLQESYDNAGLIVGLPNQHVTGVLISLDCTEEVVQEAIETGCNLIVAHHPIVFKGLKRFNGNSYVERTVMKAIKNDIAIYAAHTNLDNVYNGVNHRITQQLGLQNTQILAPKKQMLRKLTVFVPQTHTPIVLEALHTAGAGNIGNYSHCSFVGEGIGSFLPNEKAKPSIGQAHELEQVNEQKIEVILPAFAENRVLQAMRTAHPYEEVAYYLQTLENQWQEVGSGMVGELAEPLSETAFLAYLKEKMQLACVRHTPLRGKKVERVAVCGGSGIFLLGDAMRAQADVFVTADVKYHEFFDAEGRLIIADIGHYESEIFTKDLFLKMLSEKFSNIALNLSKIVTNPINYY